MTNLHTDQGGVGDGARRRRPLLASLTTLGVVTGLLGVAGVFAAGSDSASTGTNDAISGEFGGGGGEPAEIDLELATATLELDEEGLPVQHCNEDWSDDLTTGVITSDGADLDNQQFSSGGSSGLDAGGFCIRNVGSSPAAVTASSIDIVDLEVGCSPGEAALDASCGGDGVGELSTRLTTYFGADDCNGIVGETGTVATLASEPIDLVVLGPNEEIELCAVVHLEQGDGSDQAVQSDQASWRYRFDAVVGVEEPECVEDQFEDNDTQAQAAPYAGPVQGATCSNADQDWFAYQHSGGTLHAFLDFDAPAEDLDLRLLNAQGSTISNQAGTQTDEAIAVPLEPGTYFVQVRSYTGEATYSLTLTSTGA